MYNFQEPSIRIIFLLFCLQALLSCNVEKPLFPNEKLLFLNEVSVKKYPIDTPFVYYNNINVNGSLSKNEKNKLTENLSAYWHDSLYAARVRKFIFFYTLKNPPIFDSANFTPTIKYMSGYLFSQGYFNSTLNDTFRIDTFFKAGKPPQIRTYVSMLINPGKQTIIDSFGFDIEDSTVQKIAKKNVDKSYIKPGKTPYSKQVIAAELDRLIGSFRRNGYFLIKRENFVAEVDTTDISLLQLTTDPFEQAKIIAEAEKKKLLKPTSTVLIKERLRDSLLTREDSAAFKQFYVGNIYYYPETRQTDFPDILMNDTAASKKWQNNFLTMFYDAGLFTPRIFRTHTYMRKGALYNVDRYYRTLNTFSQIGAWRQVDTRTVIRNDTIDFHIFMYPEKKQNITYNLEASRNTGDFLSSSNLFGLSFNITYRNRNLWKNAIQSSTSLRNGIELSFLGQNNSILQSLQSSITQTLSFPGLISPIKMKKERSLEAVRTILNLNASYSERKDFFRLRSFVSNWGYEWKKKTFVWQYRPLNIELYSLDTLPLLDSAFRYNPFLRTSFNTGSVVSQQLTFNHTYAGKSSGVTNYLRVSLEEAGLLLGRIKSLQDNIYQFVKVEAEYRKAIVLSRDVLALRAMAGVGFNYSNDPRIGKTLPFFKQFIAGGPNSMRAWGLRLLGLGSSLLSDTSSTFRDRYGDMQLEANIEYRYPYIHFSSVDIKGALFTDIGNIWNIRTSQGNPQGVFTLNKLGEDIAIAVGTGIRFDFNFFLIRVDIGFKLKDPAKIENNGWLDVAHFTWRNHEFEKYDASGNLVSPKRNNYAIQLGIGLPF